MHVWRHRTLPMVFSYEVFPVLPSPSPREVIPILNYFLDLSLYFESHHIWMDPNVLFSFVSKLCESCVWKSSALLSSFLSSTIKIALLTVHRDLSILLLLNIKFSSEKGKWAGYILRLLWVMCMCPGPDGQRFLQE